MSRQRLGAERAAAALGGAEVLHFVPQTPDDPEEQIRLIDEALALNPRPDAFVLSPVHATRVDPAIRRIAAAGIPMVGFVNPIDAAPMVGYVSSDDFALAQAIADHLHAHLGGISGGRQLLHRPLRRGQRALFRRLRGAAHQETGDLGAEVSQLEQECRVERTRRCDGNDARKRVLLESHDPVRGRVGDDDRRVDLLEFLVAAWIVLAGRITHPSAFIGVADAIPVGVGVERVGLALCALPADAHTHCIAPPH